MNTMLTIPEVTKMIHIHPNTLRRWSAKGLIPVYRINSRGDRRYKPADIKAFLRSFNPYKIAY